MPTTLTIHDATSSGEKTHSFTLECLTERMTVRELLRARIYQEVQDYNARKSGLLLVVPIGGFVKVPPRLRVVDYFPAHVWRLPRRVLRSARMVSHAIPFSGWLRNRPARASHSSINSGGNSSAKDSRMPSTTSR